MDDGATTATSRRAISVVGRCVVVGAGMYVAGGTGWQATNVLFKHRASSGPWIT